MLESVADGSMDQEWLDVVATVVTADSVDERRSGLVVRRDHGVAFHATFADNRASIRAHGLDWTRFVEMGIAGSRAPEAAGIFLCSDVESAKWFAEMGQRRGRNVDIWAVALNGQSVISDPSSSGGLDDDWMICLNPIPAEALDLALPSPDQ